MLCDPAALGGGAAGVRGVMLRALRLTVLENKGAAEAGDIRLVAQQKPVEMEEAGEAHDVEMILSTHAVR